MTFFSTNGQNDKKPVSKSTLFIYITAGIYVASSLVGQMGFFAKHPLITVGTKKIKDQDVVHHIRLLALDPKAQTKQRTYDEMFNKITHMALLDQEAQTMGIRVSRHYATESLGRNPLFQGEKKNVESLLQKNGLTMEQAIRYEQRRLTHKRLKTLLTQNTAPIPQPVLDQWNKGWCQQRKGIYRTFPINEQSQTSSDQETMAEMKTMHPTQYRTVAVVALHANRPQDAKNASDLQKTPPKDLKAWAEQNKYKCDVFRLRPLDMEPLVLPGLSDYARHHSPLFFQAEQMDAFPRTVFSTPLNAVKIHRVSHNGKDVMYFAIQVIKQEKETDAQKKSRAAYRVRLKKAKQHAQDAANQFAQSTAVTGTAISRFGFDTLTVRDCMDDIMVYDDKASYDMNTAFPIVCDGLFALKPGQSSVQRNGLAASSLQPVIYVVKPTHVINASDKNPVCNADTRNQTETMRTTMNSQWTKAMWQTYIQFLWKKYQVNFSYDAINRFVQQMRA